jgi:hypothetical protein
MYSTRRDKKIAEEIKLSQKNKDIRIPFVPQLNILDKIPTYGQVPHVLTARCS